MTTAQNTLVTPRVLRDPAGRSAVRRLARALADESGAATAEYAIATLAAVGLAGLLVVVLRGDDVKGLLVDLIHRALTSAG
ncbi:DUF4244 domain-containing protein [Herbiconiux sp. 11R-BC]|uniref:DUF4244 domain-containing protein n=1 Tax=Herbiconiux sp. 11R-BC TaxID=3111637 RepID=UPI003BFF1C0A